MTQGKSQLNPHATPYIPVSKLLSGTRDEAWTICCHKNNEVNDKSMGHNLPEFLAYDILTIEHLTSEESLQAGQHVIPNDIHRDELSELDSFIEKLDSLSSLFPDISVEYLSELLDVHHGDLQETIVVMQQFEVVILSENLK